MQKNKYCDYFIGRGFRLDMVILFVTPFLRKKGEVPKGGGLETYLFRTIGALKRFGHESIILSLGDKDEHYIDNGIEIIFTGCCDINFGKGNIRLICNRIHQSVVINKKIREITHNKKIDIVQFPSIYGLSFCYFGKTPAVMRLSSYSKIYYADFFEKKKLYLWSFFERAGSRRCNAVFAPSKVMAQAFSKDIHRKVSVIESPFWNDVLLSDTRIYDDKLQNKKYMLFFGRLAAEKGILVISKCIQRFLEKNTEYFLVCCGQDNIIDCKSAVGILKSAAGKYRDRIIYISQLSHGTLYPVIQHADFVIMPSIAENLSNACIEAMYFERVVIGTDGTSYEQLIDDGTSGLLCRPGDSEDLLAKMNQAVSMGETEKAEIGKNAKKRIERLAPEYTVKKLIQYYKYTISNRENRR